MQGKCTNCGKFGHKTAKYQSKMVLQKKEECRESKKNKKEKKTECDMSNIQCFQCGEMGHFQSKCPKAKSKMGNTKQPEKSTWSS